MLNTQIMLSDLLLWKEHLGVEANELSPLPTILADSTGQATPAGAQPESDLSKEELGMALTILWLPERCFTIRCGGNLIAPKQMRVYFSPEHDAHGLAMCAQNVTGVLEVKHFASFDEWAEWVAQLVDPIGLSQPGEPMASGPMSYGQLLHLLHTADVYRRLYYESMLDYIPSTEFVFSSVRYASILSDATFSEDYRWLAPCLLYMLPHAIPTDLRGLSAEFQTMREWGLIARDQQDDDYDAYFFTDKGVHWGLEFMTRWVSALGLTVTVHDGKELKTGDQGLFLLGSTLSIHAFNFIGLGQGVSIEHAALNPDGVARLLEPYLTMKVEGESTQPPVPTKEQGYHSASAPIPTPSTTYCSNCGQKAKPGDNFCTNCGNKLQ